MGHSFFPKNDSNMEEVKKPRNVEINITKHEYGFIDGATGEKISAKEFAEKYPAVGLTNNAVRDGHEAGDKADAGKEKQ